MTSGKDERSMHEICIPNGRSSNRLNLKRGIVHRCVWIESSGEHNGPRPLGTRSGPNHSASRLADSGGTWRNTDTIIASTSHEPLNCSLQRSLAGI